MFDRISFTRPAFAVLLLAGVAALSAPSIAAAQSAAPTAASAKAAQKPIDKAEAQIAKMHANLKITPAQDPQWEDFVKAERDSAAEMSDLIGKRTAAAGSMNAVDDFKSYEGIAEAHADGLKKVVPAFEKLYASLSDDQKKMADAEFRRTPGGKGAK